MKRRANCDLQLLIITTLPKNQLSEKRSLMLFPVKTLHPHKWLFIFLPEEGVKSLFPELNICSNWLFLWCYPPLHPLLEAELRHIRTSQADEKWQAVQMILLVLLYQRDTRIPSPSREVRGQGLLQNSTPGTEDTWAGWGFKPASVELLNIQLIFAADLSKTTGVGEFLLMQFFCFFRHIFLIFFKV